MASAVGNGRDDAAVYVRAAHVHHELERQRAVLGNERRTDDRRARQGAGYTSELIRRVARTFEETATLAEQQADRQEEAGRPDAAARERSVAERARAAAELGRARAERLLSPRVDQAQNVPAVERSRPLDDTG